VPAAYSPQDGAAWIERQWNRIEGGEGISLAIADRVTGEAVGLVTLLRRPQRDSAGVGYWVIDRARRLGFASRAVRLVTSWAVTDAGLQRVEAFVEACNLASRRVLEKSGFHQEGHLRSFLSFPSRRADAIIYSLLPTD
jgi:RimJ/RimL family protein N-acetyltransferase